jgi:hypothetical protein
MSEYLSQEQLKSISRSVRKEFETLFASPMLVRRPRSRQWTFFKRLFSALCGEKVGGFTASRTHLAQYKFEIESGLRRFYEMAGSRQVPYIFAIRHRGEALTHGLIDEEYPRVNDYVLLVADTSRGAELPPKKATRELIERVIDDAVRAELAVYRACPRIDLVPLDGLFLRGGEKFRYIENIARQHHLKGWTISEPPANPSTGRLIRVRVVSIGREKAVVRAVEYWYLRWWSTKEQKYVDHPWKETSRCLYWLVLRDGRWLVEADHLPRPRAQAPRRMGRNLN